MLEAIAALRGADRRDASPPSTSTRTGVGDHICYISDLSRLQADYPGWEVTVSLEPILEELARAGAPALS